MEDIIRVIEDSEGNIIRVGSNPIGTILPRAAATPTDASDIHRKFLKDGISNKFYPITFRRNILGGIGRGSSKEVIDFASYIHPNYEGSFKLVSMGGHVHYFILDLNRKAGTLQPDSNVLINTIPVTYLPEKDMVFRSSISPDDTSVYTLYLKASDGRVYCHVKPKYEVIVDPTFALKPINTANKITGMAAFIK